MTNDQQSDDDGTTRERYGVNARGVVRLNGVDTALEFTDVETEYGALRRSVGLIDYSHQAKTKISGPASMSVLQRVATKNVKYLRPGRSKTMLFLDGDGLIIGDGTVYCIDEDEYLVECFGAQRSRVQERIWAAARDCTVELEDQTRSMAVIGLEGPKSWMLLQQATGFDVYELPYQRAERISWLGSDVMLARTGYTAEYGYKIFCTNDELPVLWKEILKQGKDAGIEPCGMNAVEICMLEARFQNVEKESMVGRTPLETGLIWLVDPEHASFDGRDALMRQAARGVNQLLVCFVASCDTAVRAGAGVKVGDVTCGHAAHSLVSPGLRKAIGVAYLDYSVAVSGLDFEIVTDTGPVPCKTVSSPFLVPESWTQKGGPRG